MPILRDVHRGALSARAGTVMVAGASSWSLAMESKPTHGVKKSA